jgi:hypothetical protein
MNPEGSLYHQTEFDRVYRVTEYAIDSVELQLVDGDHTVTLSRDEFDDRVEDEKLVPKTAEKVEGVEA